MEKRNDIAGRAAMLVRSLILFAVLYLSFLVIGGLLIWLSYLWIVYTEMSKSTIIYPSAAILFFYVKVIQSFSGIQRINRPDLTLITAESQPQLFRIIHETCSRMKIKPPARVYLSASASASVFLKAGFWNMFFPSRKELEIGMGLLNMLNNDELRAALAHELGHFSQENMKLCVPVYIIGQSVQYMIRDVKNKRKNIIEGQIYSFVDLFSGFAKMLFAGMSKDYALLLDELEYDADRIAAKHTGKKALETALLKASFATRLFDLTINSAGVILQSEKAITDLYAAQRCMAECLTHNTNALIPEDAPLSNLTRRRIEKLQQTGLSTVTEVNNLKETTETVRNFPELCLAFTRNVYLHQLKTDVSRLSVCNMKSYRKWIEKQIDRAKNTAKSIPLEKTCIEIVMEKGLHKFPFADSTFDVWWDDEKLGKGWYKKGFTLKTETSAGHHQIKIDCGFGLNESIIPFHIERPGNCTISLDYQYHFLKAEFRFFIKKSRIDDMLHQTCCH